MGDTFEEIRTVVADVLKIDANNIKPETRLVEDLKADSMDQFFLIDGFCEKFGIEIDDEEARQIKTVGDAVAYVEKQLK